MASAIALSQRLQQLAADLDRYTAPGHQDTVRLAAQVGSVKPGQSCWRRPKTEPLLRVVPTQN